MESEISLSRGDAIPDQPARITCLYPLRPTGLGSSRRHEENEIIISPLTAVVRQNSKYCAPNALRFRDYSAVKQVCKVL